MQGIRKYCARQAAQAAHIKAACLVMAATERAQQQHTAWSNQAAGGRSEVVAHLALFSKPHSRFNVSATAVCFVGVALQAGADCQDVARLFKAALALLEPSGPREGSMQPVSTVMLLTAVPATWHLRVSLCAVAWITATAVWLPVSVV
jgi:hypothetical protein